MFAKKKLLALSAIVLISLFKPSTGASLSIYEQKKYQHLIEGQGLYSPTDDVQILTAENFKERVFNQKNAWIVEFYNSWCGFCQRFAPSWKALATDMKLWKSMINVGAIDCSDDKTSPLCREFEVMGYPTLRYFHEHYTNGVGANVDKGTDMEGHKVMILKHMMLEQTLGRGVQYPKLSPYGHSTLKELFEETPVNSKYAFILIDDSGKLLGPQVELDFWGVQEVGVRYSTPNNSALVQNINAKEFPFMMVLTDTNRAHIFPAGLKSRQAIRSAIVEYVKPNVKIHNFDENPDDIYTGKWLDIKVPDMESLMEAKNKQMLRKRVKDMGDTVFQVDLETALKYSLKHDIANAKNITGPKLKALRDYVDVLLKYFPFGRNGQLFLMKLYNLVNTQNQVEGSAITDLVSRNEPENVMVFSSKVQWMACEGSSPEKRGFPCGLWKMFHYLTVRASEDLPQAQLSTEMMSKLVLLAMHGYVKYFFGCADCSRHFQDMAAKRNIEGVDTLDNAILWLWKAHNEVNLRLAGDPTEDPEYPKIEFPSAANCPLCKSGEKWDEKEVLRYLKTMYGRTNISYLGSNLQNVQQHQQTDSEQEQERHARSVFEQFDASMCFILYFISFLLIAILIRLFLKRGYRKKMYAHDLLGKV